MILCSCARETHFVTTIRTIEKSMRKRCVVSSDDTIAVKLSGPATLTMHTKCECGIADGLDTNVPFKNRQGTTYVSGVVLHNEVRRRVIATGADKVRMLSEVL